MRLLPSSPGSGNEADRSLISCQISFRVGPCLRADPFLLRPGVLALIGEIFDRRGNFRLAILDRRRARRAPSGSKRRVGRRCRRAACPPRSVRRSSSRLILSWKSAGGEQSGPSSSAPAELLARMVDDQDRCSPASINSAFRAIDQGAPIRQDRDRCPRRALPSSCRSPADRLAAHLPERRPSGFPRCPWDHGSCRWQ